MIPAHTQISFDKRLPTDSEKPSGEGRFERLTQFYFNDFASESKSEKSKVYKDMPSWITNEEAIVMCEAIDRNDKDVLFALMKSIRDKVVMNHAECMADAEMEEYQED